MYRHIRDCKRRERDAPMTAERDAGHPRGRGADARGMARDVRLTIDGGAIAAVETDAPAAARRRALRDRSSRRSRNLHSHAFQRGMAGLAERRGDEADTFWTWRETMYRFALAMSPDDVEAVAAQLYVEMLEAGFAAVGEFHYLHNAPDGAPYAAPAEMAARIVAAAQATGIGLTLLPVFYAHATFGGAPPEPEQRRFVTDLDGFARLLDDCRALMRGRRRSASRRIRCAPRRPPNSPPSSRSPATGRSTSMPPSRSRRSRTASPGRARGRSNGCSTTRMSTRAGASSTPPT